MKCINCYNDIPDASTVCPFCNSKVEPAYPATPTFNLESTSSLPVTPNAPVLPQDQSLDATQNIDIVQPDANVFSTFENVDPQFISRMNANVSSGDADSRVDMQRGVNRSVQRSFGSVEQLSKALEQASSQGKTMGSESGDNSRVMENAIASSVITPDGELVAGGKIGSSVAPVIKKNKKKKMFIVLIVVVIILAVGGAAFAYYYSQYKTANKRVSSVFKGITSMTSTLKNETIDKASGTYNLDLNIDYNNEAIKTKIDGTYARDLSSGAIDLTTNIQSFVKGEELLNNPLNLEIYYNDSKVYVLLENFFDMYIYDEYDKLDTYFEAIEQNNINYVSLINSLKTAINSGLTNMNSTQTVEDEIIHGISSKVNVVQIKFTARNQSLFANAFYRVLANDATFVSEMAKLTGKTEEVLKDDFSNAMQNKEYADRDLTIEIYTEMFGEKFVGLKITTKENFINKLIKETESNEVKVLEVYPITNGYGLNYKSGSQNILEGTLEKTLRRTSTTNESNYKVYFTYYHESVAYKIDANLDLIGDVNPKDAKVVVKNSVNKIYLTEENKAAILEKYNQAGNISLHYPDIISNYLKVNSVQNNDLTPDNASMESCLIVSACQASSYEGYLMCKSVEGADILCQDAWVAPGN